MENNKATYTRQISFKRSSKIINRKYIQFFFPMFLTAITAVLCNFIDSVIVSNMLGQESLCIVSLGAPMFTLICVLCVFIGSGGLIKYSNYLGKMETEKAGKYYFTSMFWGILISLVGTALGEIFAPQIASILCSDPTLQPDLTIYIQIYMLGYPIIMFVETISFFIPAAGKPVLVTWINIVINVVNILLDCIFINFFGLGVFGAAYATISGYCLAFLLIIITYVFKYFHLEFKIDFNGLLSRLKVILSYGFGEGFGQLGQFFRHIFCNNLAIILGGITGTTAMAIVNQTMSIGSIVILGILYSIFPVLSCLQGQNDKQGIKYLLQFIFAFSLIANFAISLFFLIFPNLILSIFGITDSQTWEIGIIAIRLIAFSFFLRTIYSVLRCYLQCVGRLKYANTIALFESLLGIVICGSILSAIFGLFGLFASFTVYPLAILIVTFVVNYFICKKSNGKYKGYFLIEQNTEEDQLLDVTVKGDPKDVTTFAEKIQYFCMDHEVEANLALRISIACEELCMYTTTQKEYKDYGMDIIVRVDDKAVTLHIRSAGKPINILDVKDEENARISVLKHIADEVDYEYVIGLNQSKVVVNR